MTIFTVCLEKVDFLQATPNIDKLFSVKVFFATSMNSGLLPLKSSLIGQNIVDKPQIMEKHAQILATFTVNGWYQLE